MVYQLPCSYVPALVCVHIKRHKIVKRKQQNKAKCKNFKDKKKDNKFKKLTLRALQLFMTVIRVEYLLLPCLVNCN